MSRRWLTRGLVGIGLIAGTLAGLPHADAVPAPKTLAVSTPVGAAPVTPGFPIDFVGVLWTGPHADASIRFATDGVWGPWLHSGEDGVEVPGEFASALVPGHKADTYQVVVPGAARRPRAVAINTTDGPEITVGSEPASAAGAAGQTISRQAWGADESFRFDGSGREIWPPAYYPAQKLTVHHTATANGDADPAATVRAIYRYHAVDRGFGDIGYQYLVDESGGVYEGRWSGTDGDPAHDAAGKVVTAAHVGGYNSGNVGVALLGTLTVQPPTASARDTLDATLAQLAARHAIAAQGSGQYVNPVDGVTWTGPNISGHRDWGATECPGGALYAQLLAIRSAVAALVDTGTTTTSSTTTTTAADTTAPVISGLTATTTVTGATVTWTTNEPATSQVEYWVKTKGSPSSTLLTTPSTGLVTTHVVTLSGLTPATQYQYRARSKDFAGNSVVSATGTFRTAAKARGKG